MKLTTAGVPTVWHDEYFCPEASNHLGTRKQREILLRARDEELIQTHEDEDFDEAETWQSIATVHDPLYVDAVRTGKPRSLAESQSLTWSPMLARAVARTWSGNLATCRLALEKGLAFHLAGGAHHATRSRGGGFCTFNYVVGSGRALIRLHSIERVLVIDLDTHQGNGTWELTDNESGFALFDISGASFDVPTTKTHRLSIHLVQHADEYFRALEKLPELMRSFRPDLVQYLAGMDCHQHDEMGGIRGMSAERLAERDQFVFETARQIGAPVALSPAGGYQTSGATVKLHLQTLRIASGVDATSATDRTIDELAHPNERTYRCILKDLEGGVVETTPWTGEPPDELCSRDGARRFERTSYRPRVLMVIYEERTNET